MAENNDSFVALTLVFDPTVLVAAAWIVVRPMYDAALFAVFILAPDAYRVILGGRHTVGKIDIVGEQYRVPGLE